MIAAFADPQRRQYGLCLSMPHRMLQPTTLAAEVCTPAEDAMDAVFTDLRDLAEQALVGNPNAEVYAGCGHVEDPAPGVVCSMLKGRTASAFIAMTRGQPDSLLQSPPIVTVSFYPQMLNASQKTIFCHHIERFLRLLMYRWSDAIVMVPRTRLFSDTVHNLNQALVGTLRYSSHHYRGPNGEHDHMVFVPNMRQYDTFSWWAHDYDAESDFDNC